MSLKLMQRRFGRVSGLTLIEIMIALAIVGILAAIAIPAYANYRDRIDRAKAIQDIAMLQAMISDYKLNSGSFPADLAAIGNGGMLDPWKHTYVYVDLSSVHGHGAARKDHKLNPINSDFDLYSMGKDGVSKPQLTQKDSLDDIVRAGDGAYVGLAAEYSP